MTAFAIFARQRRKAFVGELSRSDADASASPRKSQPVLWLCSPTASFLLGHSMAIDSGILA